MLEMGRMVAESVMLMEREEVAGPDYYPPLMRPLLERGVGARSILVIRRFRSLAPGSPCGAGGAEGVALLRKMLLFTNPIENTFSLVWHSRAEHQANTKQPDAPAMARDGTDCLRGPISSE